jgi:hypothetical protein
LIIVPDGRRIHLRFEETSGDGQNAPLAQETIGFVSERDPAPTRRAQVGWVSVACDAQSTMLLVGCADFVG